MGERLDRTQEVGGSNPPSSIAAESPPPLRGSKDDFRWQAEGERPEPRPRRSVAAAIVVRGTFLADVRQAQSSLVAPRKPVDRKTHSRYRKPLTDLVSDPVP